MRQPGRDATVRTILRARDSLDPSTPAWQTLDNAFAYLVLVWVSEHEGPFQERATHALAAYTKARQSA